MSEILNVLRLSEGLTGESHFDNFDISRALTDFAPPARPLFVSPVEKASGYVVIRLPVGWVGDPHPSPRRQILFCLSGAVKITASDGEIRTIKAGDAWLMEDTNGKGHRTEVASDEPFDAVIILLA
jgi:quercetin dioxygenase-like cupin family protein